MKIRELEKLMLEKFPLETAEEWDTTGVTSGDEDKEITRVAVALDPSISAVKEAKKRGCNLLVTHHPAYIGEIAGQPLRNIIFHAPNYGVALMNFHTCLDVSDEGAATLPNLIGLNAKQTLILTCGKLGFGKICTPANGKSTTLSALAKKCESVFGRKPRVWGKASSSLKKIVTTTGSVGRLDDEVSVLQAAIDKRVDCIICGEVKYHDAIEMLERGICIIELGHDVSELPLCDVLKNSLVDCGIAKIDIIMIDQNNY